MQFISAYWCRRLTTLTVLEMNPTKRSAILTFVSIDFYDVTGILLLKIRANTFSRAPVIDYCTSELTICSGLQLFWTYLPLEPLSKWRSTQKPAGVELYSSPEYNISCKSSTNGRRQTNCTTDCLSRLLKRRLFQEKNCRWWIALPLLAQVQNQRNSWLHMAIFIWCSVHHLGPRVWWWSKLVQFFAKNSEKPSSKVLGCVRRHLLD